MHAPGRPLLPRAALLLGVILCGSCTPAPRPSVLLVVVDTLRADHLSRHGYARPTSPQLDALAADGTVYERAYSQAPWTTPSVGSILSSRFPSSLGIRHERSRLPDAFPLLPELLRDQGYRTGAVVSHSFISRKWGFARGFDHFDQTSVSAPTSSPAVTEGALALIDRLEEPPERPFFLMLHYFDPHFGYIEHEEFRFEGRDEDYAGPIRSDLPHPLLEKLKERLTQDDLAELDRLYASEVAFTDAAIGRVLEHLRERGRYDDTLIIVTADHGEEFLDHGAFGHTKTLFAELVHVPLIVKYPRGKPGVVAEPVALIDIFPTVLDVLGLPPDPSLRGRSLLSLEPGQLRPVFMETRRGARLEAVVQGDDKLIWDVKRERGELYDLAADPGERRDQSAARPERVAELRALLAAWRRDNRPPEGGPAPLVLDAEEQQRLHALGYLGEAE